MRAAFTTQLRSTGKAGAVRLCASYLADVFLTESDRWFLWIPVLFGTGIALYFSLGHEPHMLVISAGIMAAFGLFLLSRGKAVGWPLSAALLIIVLGFSDAKLRVSILDTPVLGKTTGAVTLTGWIERNEPRGGKVHRIVLRVITLEGSGKGNPLYRVRLTSRFGPPPITGSVVKLRALIRSAPLPVAPGGFDFARLAWFSGISAVGFALTPPEILENPPESGIPLKIRSVIERLRHAVDERIHDALPEESGAIASALLTGIRGRIPEPALQALRHSGLAHLLAISGLHMALIAGALFWLLRASLAAVPAISLRFSVKKIAAIIALGGGGFYLALSGAAIATQRAYLMMGIMFLAILLDRPAITLRNVALAALVVLAFVPESLFSVSFQMSFAAAAALVAFYERMSERQQSRNLSTTGGAIGATLRKTGAYLTGIAFTTLVAGIAVAPFAAYHFHKLAQFSLIANLAAMPIFGLAIMPMALATLLALPLGLEYWPLQAMAWGITQVITIANSVADWEGAVVRVAAMPGISLAVLTLGGLWLAIWRGRWRYAGLVMASLGLILASGGQRPDILIGRDGELVAIRGSDGKLGIHEVKGSRYSLEHWLAADADARGIDAVRKLAAFRCDDIACLAEVKGKSVAVLLHPAAIREECERADIVIARFPLGNRCPKARVNIDRLDLGQGGAHALYLEGQSIRIETVAQKRGDRPWTGPFKPSRTLRADGKDGGTAQVADVKNQ